MHLPCMHGRPCTQAELLSKQHGHGLYKPVSDATCCPRAPSARDPGKYIPGSLTLKNKSVLALLEDTKVAAALVVGVRSAVAGSVSFLVVLSSHCRSIRHAS